MKFTYLSILVIGGLFIFGCNSNSKNKSDVSSKSRDDSTTLSQISASIFDNYLHDHPQRAATLGKKYSYSHWDNISDSFLEAEYKISLAQKKDIVRYVDSSKLSFNQKITYKMLMRSLDETIEMYPWRHYNYPVNQEDGLHTEVPTFLMNVHNIDNLNDAKCYIQRIEEVSPLFKQLIQNINQRTKEGIIPPDFVFPKAIGSCNNLITGFPLDNSKTNHVLWDDFNAKIDKVKSITPKDKTKLKEDLKLALKNNFLPAYNQLIACLKETQKQSKHQVGVVRFDKGKEYYAACLKHFTTTDLTADSIYNLGVSEVARIQAEMHAIMAKVHFKNDNLKDFLKFITTDKQFFYPNTKEGGQKYLAQADGYIKNMTAQLDKLFITKPKAKLIVKAVESFREKSTGGAFYEEPSPDGSRPGRFYANLSDMSIMPIYQLEALAYHEGIPGHHMQIAIAQELKGIPDFRKYTGITAYDEGWGLYSEKLGKEIGFYTDPYQDFGRLSMELLRAARLVVDPGIHSKNWSREQAIKYFEDNTAEPPGECIKAIERYCVWPGQATGYKIGMITIQNLRAKAEKELGSKFSLREFHDVVLTSAAVPMSILTDNVNYYIALKKR